MEDSNNIAEETKSAPKVTRFNAKDEFTILKSVVDELIKRIEVLEGDKVKVYTDSAGTKTMPSRVMTTTEACAPVEPFPQITGKVNIDQFGNIPKNWRKNGDVYEKYYTQKIKAGDGFEEVVTVIDTESSAIVERNINNIRNYVERNK